MRNANHLFLGPVFGLLALLACVPAPAQLSLGGEASTSLQDTDTRTGPRTVNGGRPNASWRLDVFADAIVTGDIGVIGNIRVGQNENIDFDFLALRFANLTPLHLTVQLGKFDMPFGNLGDRRFPTRNAFTTLPTMYEYATALPSRVVPLSDVLAARGRGAGMRILEFGVYDVGAMVYGAADVFSFALAVENGTVSAPSDRLQNTNGSFGTIGRATVTALPGVTIGASYAWGAYLADPGAASPPGPALDVGRYLQRTAGIDLDASVGHLVAYAQVVHSSYDVPNPVDPAVLSALGWYGEVKVTLAPRLYVAGRVGGLHFGTVDDGGTAVPWDYDVREFEAAVGWHLARNALVKLEERETLTDAPGRPHDRLTAVQVAVRF